MLSEQQQQQEFSLGTTPMMKSIEAIIENREEMVDVICLNLGTIVRNCLQNQAVKEAIDFDKRHGVRTEKPAKVLVQESKNEMIKVIGDLCQMFNNNQFVNNPCVITYHSDYSKSIPKEVYKAPADSKYYLTMADQMVSTTIVKGNRKVAKQGKVTLIELPINDKFLPWRHIMLELKDMKNNHNVLMVSNHPVDYHVGSVSRTFRIVRSYTGDVVKYKKLGQIVFKTDTVPFNIFTHSIFGDKEDVKCSLSSNDKNTILNLAEKEEWALKTKDYIKDRLYELGIRIPTHF